MKRNIVLAVIAIILLTFYLVTYAGPYALLMLLAIPLAYFLLRIRERTETTSVTYASVEEVEQKYGELRVGYDGGLAREIATQIDTHIRK